ncbi:MAG: 4-hydroxybenzoate octaprenyltransferase [Gammaproteobacteria bacterium]|nr:4-hydroxybenzoate octaprenyltransferase [Gammaproteobacteria bacterium]
MTKFIAYSRLMRIDKPIGICLLLWPTLGGLWIASQGKPHIINICVFVLGTIIMRSAGCVINDIADRHFDAHVQRTKNRPLATGMISVKAAMILFTILCGLAFILVLFLNKFTIFLSFIALTLAIIYPFMKRYIASPQLILGLAFSWAIPMAFTAELNELPIIVWWLMLANICWIIAYDTI